MAAASWLPAVLATLGGACMGTYPVFVKTPAMRAAHVHPLVFQGYKSAWVLIIGILLIAWRSTFGTDPAYVFTPWGIASACAWVPAGFSLIASIPRVGVGTAVLIFDSTTTLVSFFVFWLVFHEPIRTHELPNGFVYYLAPLYMLGALAGMAGLVLLPPMFDQAPKTLVEPLLPSAEKAAPPTLDVRERSASKSRSEMLRMIQESAARAAIPTASEIARVRLEGYSLAVLAGVLSAAQFGMVTVGKKQAAIDGVPAEALDPLGSWTASFGLGAVVVNALALVALCTCGHAPKLQLEVRRVPGAPAARLLLARYLPAVLAV